MTFSPEARGSAWSCGNIGEMFCHNYSRKSKCNENQKIGHFGHLEEGLGQGHEEVVGEVKVLQLGQVGEDHWVQVDQVVGTGGGEVKYFA